MCGRREEVKVTGFVPVYNTLSGHYPFMEAILTTLPVVDRLIVNDGGSDDGTREAVERLQELFPKIEIVDIEHRPGKDYEGLDNAIEKVLGMIDGGWCIEVQADEFIPPRLHKPLLNEILEADREGYNSLRQDLRSFKDWNSYHKFGEKIRVFKYREDIKSDIGGDCFYYKGESKVHPEYEGPHYLPPEKRSDIPLYHLNEVFPAGKKVQARRHAKHYAREHELRNEIFQDLENAELGIKPSEKPHKEIPEIFHGLVGRKEYRIREELFDKEWLKEKGVLENVRDY